MKTSNKEIKSSVSHSNSALFAAITEIVSYDVTLAARLFERRLIGDLQDIDRTSLPKDFDYLSTDALKYVTTIIASSLALRSYKDGIHLRPNVLKNLHLPAYLHQVLSGIGEVTYELQGVRRVVDYSYDKSNIMSEEEAKQYSSVLVSYSKHCQLVLVAGVPFDIEGDHKRMSLIQVTTDDDVTHIASNEACPIVDAQEMACLYPKLVTAKGETTISKRIPAVIDHLESNDLIRKNGCNPRMDILEEEKNGCNLQTDISKEEVNG